MLSIRAQPFRTAHFIHRSRAFGTSQTHKNRALTSRFAAGFTNTEMTKTRYIEHSLSDDRPLTEQELGQLRSSLKDALEVEME